MENNKFCIKVTSEQHGKEVIKHLASLPDTRNSSQCDGSSVGSYYYRDHRDGSIEYSFDIPFGYIESELITICKSNNVMTKPIDKVTTENLKYALLLCDIDLCPSVIDKIIDLVELLEEKGDDISFKDIIGLKNLWDL